MFPSHFSSFSQFLQMGGYAVYVWPAYVICAVVLVVQAFYSRSSRKNTKEE